MELQQDFGGCRAETVASPSPSAPKSKLDMLSKDDLIKFAKKQMAAMQKMKTKCADLEKEVENMKSKYSGSNSDDSIMIQELTKKMDALLVEKAEAQQILVLSRKDLERVKQQAKDDLAMLQHELDCVIEDQQRKIKALEYSIEESNNKHQEKMTQLFKQLKNQKGRNKEKECEADAEQQAENTNVKEGMGDMQHCLEAEIEKVQVELEVIQLQKSQEVAELQASHQRELMEAHKEVENLREELAQKSLQHEEEMRALEEDYEIERRRLLLLHDELTEQLALKDSYLQDVQEEEEEPGRDSAIAKMLALSGCSQGDSSHGDGKDTESSRLRVTLEGFQAQNTMLQDELTLLSNVKAELEAELERAREEFQLEKEELVFKIDELQMNRESSTTDTVMTTVSMSYLPVVTPESDRQKTLRQLEQSEAPKDVEDILPSGSKEKQMASLCPAQGQQLLSPEEGQKPMQGTQELRDLRVQCEILTREKDSAVAEYQHTMLILQGLELELGQKTQDFVCQYKAMREQEANTLQDLQEKIQKLSQERDGLAENVNGGTEEKNSLMVKVQELEQKLEGLLIENQATKDMNVKLQALIEEHTISASKLKQTVEELTKQNEEICFQLQMKENAAQELKDMVCSLTREQNQTHSLLQLKEEEVNTLNSERVKEIQRLKEDKEKDLNTLKKDKGRELESLQNEKETDEENLEEERQKMVETRRREGTVSSSELTINNLYKDNDDLQHKLEEASSALSQAHEERDLLDSKLVALGVHLEQQISEKHCLEARLNFLTEELEQTQATMRALEECQSEAIKSAAVEVQELQTRVEELEKERVLLRRSLEEAREEKKLEVVGEELLARIEDLEKERGMLTCSLEDVVSDTEGLQKDLEDMKLANKKLIEENQKSLAQMSLVKQEREKETREMEQEKENMDKERSELEERLAEKDTLIVQLRREVAALQESAQSAPSEENVPKCFTEKIAHLERGNREKDEKMNKIKAVAVKAKKELDTSKKEVTMLKEKVESMKGEREQLSISMKDIIHSAEGYKNLQIDYDRQTEQLDKQREIVEVAERQITELTKQFSAVITQNELLNNEKEDILAAMEILKSTVRQLEAQSQELHRHTASLEADLLAERTLKEHKIKELSTAMNRVEELTIQLCKQEQQSQNTAQELDQLRKEAQQSCLLGMEMADYERLVKELNMKITKKEACLDEMNAQINNHIQREDLLNKEIEALKSQLEQGKEKTSKMKQLLVKSKKDLANVKEQEASLIELQASLKGQLEANQQQLESSKIEVFQLMAERHRLQEQLKYGMEQQQRTTSSLQQHISSLQEECNTAKAELMSTAAEFESYKVRVHNVLKQQKHKSTLQSEGDPGKLEREQLSAQVEQLQAKVVESQQSLQSSMAELQQLQTEHDTLLDRHNKILHETVSEEAELREKLLSVQSENVLLRTEQAQTQTELQSQAEAQRQGFREQVKRLQEEHRATVETLRSQLARLEDQVFTLQSSSVSVQSGRKPYEPQRRNQDHNQAGFGFVALSDLQSMARGEGEGMETTETESSSPAHTPLPSLEQLLTSPDPKQQPFEWTVEPTKQELSQKLTTATRNMEHMNSLLHETEATNAVLMEQIALLKSEVRRLERNQEREKSVANLEYLKNVLLQFIFLQSGSERQALLPVIHTMLQLSPDEKSKLAAIAQGEEEVSGSRSSGWTSYLHSWSGIR
ncbi:GRIP and coiled-coil domain-containing protein 2 [Lampris incognitus]|uniref:GRIP and coiled-coil domain-containing protein 2 n=1 Tax=Lampris incognitus TaxID=2546036 RepID=UPI0024B60D82|nr:GRIP and coiled-coil domain-containing protein 2 [Lampris incognitus]